MPPRDRRGGIGPGRPLAQISGPGLSGLTEAAKRRLLGAALTEGRRRALGLRADARALLLYLTLTLPPARLVTVFPGWKVGVVGSDGSSLAYVESRAHLGARWIGSLTAHGEGAAEEALVDAVRDWDRRGRPGAEDLCVAVVFGSGAEDGTVDLAWRAARRAGRARLR